MNRIDYDPSRNSLYRPGKADDFFQVSPLSGEAVVCAEIARLAYVRQPERVVEYLKRADFEPLCLVGYERRHGTQLLACGARNLADGRRTVVVTFRGTEPDDPSDLATDANLLLEPCSDQSGRTLGKVHRGFARAIRQGNGQGPLLRDLAGRLRSLRSEPLLVLLTGHSLGAALATLAARYLAGGELAADLRLYSFGSPRPGDAAFATSMEKVPHARYVNCCDLVTRASRRRNSDTSIAAPCTTSTAKGMT